MKHKLSEIQIVPIKPLNGLVAFASFVLDESWYLSSIGIFTKPGGGYRLTYPTKKVGNNNISLFHPINRQVGQEIEAALCNRYEEVTKQHDRHDSSRAL